MRPLLFYILCAAPGIVSAQYGKQWDKVRASYDKGKIYGGIRGCDRMLSGKAPDQRFLVLRAEGNNRIAEYERALRDGRAARKVVQDDLAGMAALQIGIAHANLAAPDSARHWYTVALGSSVATEAHYRLGLLDRIAGRCADASTRFDAVLQREPDHVQALLGRGGCHAERGDTALARVDLDRALELAPRDPVCWNSRGYELHARAGRWREAIRDYDQAIRFDPNYSFAFNNRGWAWFQLGDKDRAVRDITLAGRKKKGNPYVYRNLGLVALSDGQTAKACGHFRQALDLRFTELYGDEVHDLMRTHCGGVVPPVPGPEAPKPPVNAPGNAPDKRTNAPERSNAP